MSGSDNAGKSADKKKCLVISVIVVILVAAIILALGLGLGLGLRDGAPTTDQLLGRIDCYPEARRDSDGTVERRDCERRGCRYDPDPRAVDAGAPACFVAEDSALGAGYSLKEMDQREDGFTATLQTNYLTQSDVTIQPLNAVMDVQYAGENLLHLKVRYYYYIH